MINDFYINQLEINIDSCNERIKIDRTITFSEKHLIPDDHNGLLLDLGRLCIASGKLNFAVEILNKVVKNSNKTLYKADSFLELANIYSRRANWKKSLTTIEEAERLYEEINYKYGIAKCYNMLASIYGDQGDIEKVSV